MIYKVITNNWIFLFLLLIILHLFLLANFRFTLWPEMVVYPYLLNSGFSLYDEILNPYPPALILILSTFSKIFGYLPKPYEMLTWAIIISTDFLIYKISHKLSRSLKLASLSLLFFIFFSIPFGINGLWFDLIQTPLILISFYFFYQYLQLKKIEYLSTALILSIVAFYIKQQVLPFLLIMIFFPVLFRKVSKKHVLKVLSFTLLFFILLLASHVIIFYKLKSLNDFIFWVFVFPFTKAPRMPGYVDFLSLKQLTIVLSLFVIFIPIIFTKVKRDFKMIIITAIATTTFAYPRFDYFHLIPTLALLSIVSGQNINFIKRSSSLIKLVVLIAIVNLMVFSFRNYSKDFRKETRFFEKEIFSTAKILSIYTPKSYPIYIQNGPDQLFPLANRFPPKPWADEFPWYLEIKGVQEKIIEGLELSKPSFIVYQPYSEGQKYDLGVYKPHKLSGYLDKNYQDFSKISDNLILKTKK